MSKLGLASRTTAIGLVLDGRVRVDGRVVRDPGRRVVPETARIAIDGDAVTPPATRTIALHKPRGVVTTRHDPEGRPTVYGLIAAAGDGLAPVGRLDLASTGLLLCTNDTRFGAWLTDPASGVEREYIVTVRGEVTPDVAAALEQGLQVDGEWLQPTAIRVRKASGRESHLTVVLCEGRNREIRRLFAAAGHEVTRLTRIRIGGLDLGDLAPGAWRDISPENVARAFPEYSGRRSRRPRRTTQAR
ncbi:MAG: rRNA pseudouridine synthase [Acidobacteria bacterium]|nr:rRNA pseudouridine synthase [Acidobacteriota bacterium]